MLSILETAWSLSPWLLTLIVVSLAVSTLCIYRLFFHPLARFSGPFLAALSKNWQARHMRLDHSEAEYERLHEKYGTSVLRVAPNTLHLSDPTLFNVVHSRTEPFPKEPAFYSCFGIPHTTFTETDIKVHQQRRKVLNPAFARPTLVKFEPVIHQKLFQMGDKLRRIMINGPIDSNYMFRCLAADIVAELSFGGSLDLLHESEDSFHSKNLDRFIKVTEQVLSLYTNPVMRKISEWLPLWLAAQMNDAVKSIYEMQNVTRSYHVAYKQRTSSDTQYPVTFDNLSQFSTMDQIYEATAQLVAGSDTTAFTLSAALFEILSRPELTRKIIAAVNEAMPDPEQLPSFMELEKVQILSVTLKEVFRIHPAVRVALPRVVPKTKAPFMVEGKLIPPGSVINTAVHTVHASKQIWGPDASEFNPDRWLGPDAKLLDGHLSAFGKGFRSCIGQNLANANLVLTLSYLFRNFDMTLKISELKTKDYFGQQVLAPGVPIQFADRAKH